MAQVGVFLHTDILADTSFYTKHTAALDFLIQSRALEADHTVLAQFSQDFVDFYKKDPILPAFDSLVVADSGSLDRSDVADTNVVPELHTLARRVSKSTSFAAAALSMILNGAAYSSSKRCFKSKRRPILPMPLPLNLRACHNPLQILASTQRMPQPSSSSHGQCTLRMH